MDFTKEQEQAIYQRGEDIIVSAGAGAGKTRVLVTRITEMILDASHPISADEFLVLTFTNAAAGEMKERIIKELEERLMKQPDNRWLRKQIRVVKHADISTVHSFCNRLIRTHFQELDLNPAFRIGEEGELQIMRKEAMEKLLEEKYLEGKESFLSFVDSYAQGKDDKPIETMIEEIYTFSRGFPDAGRWFSDLEEEFSNLLSEENVKNSRAMQVFMESCKTQGIPLLKKLEDGLSYFAGEEEPARYYKAMWEEKNLVQGILEAKSYPDIFERLHQISFVNFSHPTKVEKQWPYREAIIDIHNQVKKWVGNLLEHDFSKSLSTIVREQKQLYPVFQEMISLVMDFEAIYSQKKKEKSVYDFNDLEHFAIKLLIEGYDEEGNAIPSSCAREIASKYKAIFVDEYQDTNLVQELIIETLKQCGEAELFVVGDVKQSIYRFRQARPDLFLNRYHRYQNGEGVKIELRDNFRSSPDVLAFCNEFFRRWMHKDFGGIDYDETVQLRAGKNGPMYEVREKQEALLFLQEEEENTEETILEDVEKILSEAVMIADRIEALLEEGYHYEDMVILLRSMRGYGEILTEYFESRGIPVLCESQVGYFQTREIQVILNYLAIIDNVYQDIPMASVMLSGIGGFSPEDLASMKILVDHSMRNHYTLYDLMHLYLMEGRDEICKEKIHHFLEQLEEFREKKQEMLLHELIWDIYEKTGFYEQILSMPHGEKRRQNLRMLMKKAEEYEKTVYKGLFYFIRYMDQLRTYEVELGGGSPAGGENALHIMTIHKSKGLEYPVVFVSLLGKQINKMDLTKTVLCHPEYGLGMEQVDRENRVHSPSFLKNVIRNRIKKETLEEELRILYVAMTRAQKKLILTGVVSKSKMKKLEQDGTTIFYGEQADCCLDWVLPVLYQDGDWKECCRLYHKKDILSLKKEENQEKTGITLAEILEKEEVRNADSSPVKKAFSREYAHKDCIEWKRKYSVSELKKISMTPLPEEEVSFWEESSLSEEEIPKPLFLKEEEVLMSSTDYGTMVHKVMELLPFGEISQKKQLYDEMMKIWEHFPKTDISMRKHIYRGVEGFLFSEYGRIVSKMDKEKKLYKEYPFTIGLSSRYLYPKKEEEEMMVIQGIIDVCGEEEDGLWLLDYKTDRIKEGEESILLDRYKTQMLYYKLALEQMFGKKVKNTLIYSFALQKFLEVSW